MGRFYLGVVLELVEGGIAHLQYVDDTILFMEDIQDNIVNLKFILLVMKKCRV